MVLAWPKANVPPPSGNGTWRRLSILPIMDVRTAKCSIGYKKSIDFNLDLGPYFSAMLKHDPHERC